MTWTLKHTQIDEEMRRLGDEARLLIETTHLH